MACTESSHGSSLMPRPRDSHGSSMRVLFIEPFYGGSHRQLVDLLLRACEGGGALFSLPASKWHWRMRVSALHFATVVPESQEYKYVPVVGKPGWGEEGRERERVRDVLNCGIWSTYIVCYFQQPGLSLTPSPNLLFLQ